MPRRTHASFEYRTPPDFRAALLASALLAPAVARADGPPRLLEAPVVTAPAGGDPWPEHPSVVVVLTLDATGAVTDVTLRQGVRPDVDAAVLDAARRMRFAPAVQNDSPVPARIVFRYRLHIAEPPAPPALPAPPVAPAAPVVAPTPVAPPAAPQPEQGVTVRTRTDPGAATRVSLRAQELSTVPGTFGDATRAVASMPGVGRAPGGYGGAFSVRGADLANTGFFLDGYPVLNLYHFGAGPAIVPTELISHLDFYPGGYPSEYGRFTGGVISLESAPPPAERPRGQLEIGLLRASALVEAPLPGGRGAVVVSARQSYLETVLPLLSPGVRLSYSDASALVEYRPTDRTRVSLLLLASHDYFDATQATADNALGAFAQGFSSSLEYTFYRGIARVEYHHPSGLVAKYSAMLGYDDSHETNAHTPGLSTRFAASGAVMGQRASVRFPSVGPFSLTAGVDALAHVYKTDVSAVPDGAVVPSLDRPGNVTQSSLAAYLEQTLRVRNIELVSALRADVTRYGVNSFLLAEPRAVARVRVTDAVTVVAASGVFHQAPQLFTYFVDLGNAVIPPERAWQNSLGVEAKLPWAIDARATGYYNRLWDLSETSYSQPSGPVQARALDARSDVQGQAYGLEFFLRRRLSHGVYAWASYTLSRSERWRPGGPVEPFWADQTHVFNAAASWDVTEHLRVGARFQIASGRPAQSVNAYYDADAGQFAAQRGALDQRGPMFHQLDLRVDYHGRVGPVQLGAFIDVMNVYNYSNAEQWVYRYDGREREPGPGLPILPNVGVRGEL